MKVNFKSRTKKVVKKTNTALERIKQRQLKLREIFGKRISAEAKFLAKEVQITTLFVERLARESGKRIVVIPIANTGTAYSWGLELKTNPQIVVSTPVHYPSSNSPKEYYDNKFREIMNIIDKHEKAKTIFVLIDASDNARMPSSFVGKRVISKSTGQNILFTSQKNSLSTRLKSEGHTIKLAGYKFSMGETENKNKLPKITSLANTNIVLFNPVKRRRIRIAGETWRPAIPHDSNIVRDDPKYKELVQNELILMQKK